MADKKRIDERTPCGGAYSEMFFFDKDDNPVDEKIAVKCIIHECDSHGNIIQETVCLD